MTDAPDPFDALLSRLREDPALGNLLGPDAPVLVWNEDAESSFGRPRRPQIWAPASSTRPRAFTPVPGQCKDCGRLPAGRRRAKAFGLRDCCLIPRDCLHR